ncbi:MAG: phage baseplate assembly protein [Chitinispirillaceae bacterium]|nr:phage baseplate assembly protein [Chitinispirillaceae bacterium]
MVRAIIQGMTWIAGKLRRFTGTGLPGQMLRNREIMQHYGFASDPPAGSAAVVIGLGNNLVCVAEDDPSKRPDLNAMSGASSLYSDATHYILIKKDGTVEVKTDKPVIIESDDVRIGRETLTESLERVIKGETFLTLFNSHTHVGNLGAPSSPVVVQMSAPLHLSTKVKAV